MIYLVNGLLGRCLTEHRKIGLSYREKKQGSDFYILPFVWIFESPHVHTCVTHRYYSGIVINIFLVDNVRNLTMAIWEEDNMAEEQVEGAYSSLHTCVRNTSSDAEDLTEHPLRVGRSPWPPKRNIQIHAELGLPCGCGSMRWCGTYSVTHVYSLKV